VVANEGSKDQAEVTLEVLPLAQSTADRRKGGVRIAIPALWRGWFDPRFFLMLVRITRSK
jgi:hypothetical protein